MAIAEDSNDVDVPAVSGTHTNGGTGVLGDSNSGAGVSGHSITSAAVAGESDRGSGVNAVAHGADPAAECLNDDPTDNAGPGLRARSRAAGVIGESSTWMGVYGQTRSSTGGNGVMGEAIGVGAGVAGESTDGIGVLGQTAGVSTSSAGVRGVVTNPGGAGSGVVGENHGEGSGVVGLAIRDAGVTGFHGDPQLQETTVASDGARAGVFGASDVGAGVLGYARSRDAAGVVAFGGIIASAINRPLAGQFFGNVEVNGDIFLPGADCAEQFDLDGDEEVEAGDVVVISSAGGLRRSEVAYDKAVAGVVSGAGRFRPAIILDGQRSAVRRRPIALIGKVFCKVDARYGAVGIGDLLTTSDTPGHAMATTDPSRAFGAVLGKALANLPRGAGLLPVLVCLQ
jgi:hypothetical protein